MMEPRINLFISWSKERSNKLAKLIYTFIQNVVPILNPVISSNDIEYGPGLKKKLIKAIKESDIAFFIFTPENVNEPWMSFEQGVIEGKDTPTNWVPILFGVKAEQLPIFFQDSFCVSFNNERFYDLLIGQICKNKGILTKEIEKEFEIHWPLVVDGVNEIMKYIPLKGYLLGNLQNIYTNQIYFNRIPIIAKTEDGGLAYLSMDENFVDLSYIERKELSNRESIIAKEQNAKGSEMYVKNSISGTYISEGLFQDYDRVFVIGNPGVGKSTFAKWVCHHWANSQFNIPSDSENPSSEYENRTKNCPVYISLRDVDFSVREPILDYIKSHYLKDDLCETEDIAPLFLEKSNNFILILDGFDELSNENQIKLKNNIDNLLHQDTGRYVLLTRPYGLLNTTGWNQSITVNIDGFNEGNIDNYVQSVLKLSKHKGRTTQELKKIINNNRVLQDYDHIPLMLSFITYIYMVTDEYEIELRYIESKYQLQKKVIYWMHLYEKSKKELLYDYKDFLGQISHIAFIMQFNQKFTIQLDTNNEKCLTSLSEIGIGNISTSTGKSPIFYFTSVTFQEYFAAEYLAPKVSKDSFMFLIRYKFFWNFAQMLFGALSDKNNNVLINEILEGIVTEDKDYYYYLEILLLAETKSSFIAERYNTVRLAKLIDFIPLAFYSKHFKSLVPLAFGSLYQKFNIIQQNKTCKIFLDRLHHFNSRVIASKNHDRTLGYEYNILLETAARRDVDFLLNFSSEFLILLKSKLNKGKIAPLINQHFELLLLFDNSVFRDLRFREVSKCIFSPIIKRKYFFYYVIINSNHFDLGAIFSDLTELFKKLDVIGKSKKHHFTKEIDLISKCIYTIGKRFDEYVLDKQDEFVSLILSNERTIYNLFSSNIIVDNEIDQHDDFTYENTIQLIFEGLRFTKRKELYPLIIEMLYFFEPDLYKHHFDDNDAFFEIINHQYFDRLKDGIVDENRIEILFPLMSRTNNLRYHFVKVRSQLFSILENYVAINKDAFENTGGYSLKVTYTRDPYFETTRVVDNLLTMLSDDHKVLFEYDKKYLIDEILKSDIKDYKYFKTHFLPRLLEKEIEIYQSDYKDFIKKNYLNNDDYKYLISIMLNESIYRYASNKDLIVAFLNFTICNLKNKEVQDKLSKIITICSYTMMLMKKSYIDDRALLSQVKTILTDKSTLKLIHKPSSYYSIASEGLAAYFLIFYYYGDHASEINIDIFKEIKRKVEKRMLFDFVIDFFTENDELKQNEFDRIRPVLSQSFIQFYDNFLDYNEDIRHKFEFDEFEGILG